MQNAKDMKGYRGEIKDALDNEFLRGAMDKFAVAYRANRANAFKGMDVEGLIGEIAVAKDASTANLEALFQEFKKNAEANGVQVHLAKTAGEANEIIAEIARKSDCKLVVKSKSMTAEETLLNHHLEDKNIEVVETDLGEWIIQLRHEGPSHMVMPAIHLSRDQVADLFTDVTKKPQTNDPQKLVKVARRELREKYVNADMGISGANFAIAETGTIAVVTNEGNARLVTTLPRVHVALCGLDKLTPTLHDALRVLKVLPRNATGQALTSYVTWVTGANECAAAQDGKKEMHIVFLDNGRSAVSKDPVFSEVLRCVRCGACANVCPVYRTVGGHKMGHIYIGAIGLILTYLFHGRDKARNLIHNCINCQACKQVCAGGIDLPKIIQEVRAIIQDEDGHKTEGKLLSAVMKNRRMFHSLLRAAKWAQKPVKQGSTGFMRHLPMLFMQEQQAFRELPVIAEKPFRDTFKKVKKTVAKPRYKVALFSGCVQDFVYPEQAEAMVKVLQSYNVDVEFPDAQSCCGLPLQMMGELKAAKDVAVSNVNAMDPSSYDYIVVGCASCGSFLTEGYENLLGADPTIRVKMKQLSDRVVDFSSFLVDVLGASPDEFKSFGKSTTYHSPCHLCRGMGVEEQPRALMRTAGLDYRPAEEEDVCCGFGGTFSVKFPEESKAILANKLKNVDATGAEMLLTDCPGCVMQLRGGAAAKGLKVQVKHMAEAIADQLK